MDYSLLCTTQAVCIRDSFARTVTIGVTLESKDKVITFIVKPRNTGMSYKQVLGVIHVVHQNFMYNR